MNSSMPNPCEICGEQSGTGASFPASTSVLQCQYHFTNIPYSLIHLSLMLHNVSNSKNYEITHKKYSSVPTFIKVDVHL